MSDATAISRALAARMPELCRELLPAGVRTGGEWRVGSVAGEKGNSLGVHLFRPKAGVWADFSSGETGDAIGLIKAVRGCDYRAAVEWAEGWLGTAFTPDQPPAAPSHPGGGDNPQSADQLDKQRAARRIFLSAQPELAGTPADFYLKARGIDLAQLSRQPRSLRFHPGLWNGESRECWPALVAAVTGGDGTIQAVHRTWLARGAGGTWGKAGLECPKASLGRVAGGTIRLWRGVSGKSLADAPAGETVVVAEGIETGLSIALACPEYRVLAAVSLGNIGRIELPAAIGEVIIAADNDAPGSPAERALIAAVSRHIAAGRKVRIARSPVGSDFNDCLVS